MKNILFVSTDRFNAKGIHWNSLKFNVCLAVVRRTVSSLMLINTNCDAFVPSSSVSWYKISAYQIRHKYTHDLWKILCYGLHGDIS